MRNTLTLFRVCLLLRPSNTSDPSHHLHVRERKDSLHVGKHGGGPAVTHRLVSFIVTCNWPVKLAGISMCRHFYVSRSANSSVKLDHESALAVKRQIQRTLPERLELLSTTTAVHVDSVRRLLFVGRNGQQKQRLSHALGKNRPVPNQLHQRQTLALTASIKYVHVFACCDRRCICQSFVQRIADFNHHEASLAILPDYQRGR